MWLMCECVDMWICGCGPHAWCSDKDVLDLFCNTGGFSLNALLYGGARRCANDPKYISL